MDDTNASSGDRNDGWKPRHLHEVVGVTLVIRQWTKSKNQRINERQNAESELAIREVNASLVFEPMAITMERIREIQQRNRQAQLGSPQKQQQQQQQQREDTSAFGAEKTLPTQPTTTANCSAAAINIVETIAEEKPLRNGTAHGGSANDGTNEAQQQTLRDGDHSRGITTFVALLHNCSRATTTVFCASFVTKIRVLLGRAVVPTGLFYCYWTLVVYAVFLYNAVVSVLFVFDDTQSSQRMFSTWITLNAFGDCINLADIFFNSRLSYLEDGMSVDNLKRLAKRYFRSTHFLFDVIALIPTDFLLLLNPNLSLARLNRMAKCYRAIQFVQMTNVRTNYPNAFRILHILVVCLILFHWNAALYFKISLINGIFSLDFAAWEFNYVKNQDPIWADCVTVGQQQVGQDDKCLFNETKGADPDTEREKHMLELGAFWKNQSTKQRFSNFSKQYSLSFYWSSLTLTTSGQQPYPTAAMHNFLEIFDTIVGVLVFAVIVGSVGNAVSTMNLTRSELQQLNDGIKFYMNYRNVTDAMQKRVLDCINYIRRHAQMQDERAVMDSILPARLRGELAVHLHLESISQVKLFATSEPSLLYELVLRLKMQMFAPSDFLCHHGDLAKEMFMLKRGVLEVIDEGGKMERLESGAVFGEMSILKPVGLLGKLLTRRRHSLRSLGYSEVYLLSQEDALEVFADYPEQRQMLIGRATQLLLERDEARNAAPQQLTNPGPLDPLELCGTESATELLSILGNTLSGLDAELDALYDKFSMTSSALKQQITLLEGTYQRNKSKLRRRRRQINSNQQ